MKILIICSKPPWEIGGIEKVVKEVGSRLALANKVSIFCRGNDKEELKWNGFTVRSFGYNLGPFSLGMVRELRKYSHEYDIIHLHGSGNPITLEAALFAQNSSIVFSPHFHPKGSTLRFDLLKKILDPILMPLILRRSKKICCVSLTESELIKTKFGISEDKIKVIYNGININAIRKARPYPNNKKIILYFGRLEKYKNIEIAISSLKYLSADYVLYIIGAGTYKCELINKAKVEGVEQRTIFLGNVSEENLYRWLKTASVVVNLSSIEAFGISVLEALAANKPVIVNNQLALRELADNFKEIVAIDLDYVRLDEFAEHIVKLSNNNFSQIDLDRYDWNCISDMYLRLYDDLCRPVDGGKK